MNNLLKVLLLTICCAGCLTAYQSTKQVLPSYFYTTWVHSHEEDNASGQYFRPSTFTFPESRGRNAYQFFKNDSLAFTSPGPVDRPVIQRGTWKYAAKSKKLNLTIAGKNRFFTIKKLSKDLLVLKPE